MSILDCCYLLNASPCANAVAVRRTDKLTTSFQDFVPLPCTGPDRPLLAHPQNRPPALPRPPSGAKCRSPRSWPCRWRQAARWRAVGDKQNTREREIVSAGEQKKMRL